MTKKPDTTETPKLEAALNPAPDSLEAAKNHDLPTRENLTGAAYRYLERFASTEVQLTRVLWRYVDRRLKGGEDRAAVAAARELAVAVAGRCVELGLVNDRLYGEAKARRMLAQGKPQRAIRQYLHHKGVAAGDIAAALDSLAEDQGEGGPDFAAAVAFARRRRLGPFRKPLAEVGPEVGEDNPEAFAMLKRKEYARMARAGFSYGLSRRVLEAAQPDELENQA